MDSRTRILIGAHYHRATDTMETLDYRFMAELVKSLVGFLGAPGR
jgi:hypothetical protein